MPSGKWNRHNLPFIYGAQYYRAPTPSPECWQRDLKLMADKGLTDVKFWVQWRVSNPAPGQYRFDDLDHLCDLAGQNNLRVTLNIIYDVVPPWVVRRHGDCLMVDQQGRPVRLQTHGARQVGGMPGPCLNHAGARQIRQDFTAAVVEHFRGHSALAMWDVWNEPEQCAVLRSPRLEHLTCYCPTCTTEFNAWLRGKYGSLQRLNEVWGRYYQQWDEVETPIHPDTFTDMVDFRLFMLDTITREARWRVEHVKRMDDSRPVYLHPVTMIAGDTWGLNQVTCADDFALADLCDCFGGTTNRFPDQPVKAVSAADGKVCYNAESHLRAAFTGSQSPPLPMSRLKREFLSQIGLGIRGFLVWQFRSETIGGESPTWGLLPPEGAETEALESFCGFRRKIAPHLPAIMASSAPVPTLGIYLPAGNEVFQWCFGRLAEYRENVLAWSRLAYEASIPFEYLPTARLTADRLARLKTLILPHAYAMTEPECLAVADWLHAGGTLIAEARTGGYNLTTGRHDGPVPGCGLADRLGLREGEVSAEAFAQTHRRSAAGDDITGIPSEVLVAMGGSFQDELVPMRLPGREGLGLGWRRCYAVQADGGKVLARFLDDSPAVIEKQVGLGRVIYAGTVLGQVLERQNNPMAAMARQWLIASAGTSAAVESTGPAWVHVDALTGDPRRPLFIVITAAAGQVRARWQSPVSLQGLFSGINLASRDGWVELTADGPVDDLFVPSQH